MNEPIFKSSNAQGVTKGVDVEASYCSVHNGFGTHHLSGLKTDKGAVIVGEIVISNFSQQDRSLS